MNLAILPAIGFPQHFNLSRQPQRFGQLVNMHLCVLDVRGDPLQIQLRQRRQQVGPEAKGLKVLSIDPGNPLIEKRNSIRSGGE